MRRFNFGDRTKIGFHDRSEYFRSRKIVPSRLQGARQQPRTLMPIACFPKHGGKRRDETAQHYLPRDIIYISNPMFSSVDSQPNSKLVGRRSLNNVSTRKLPLITYLRHLSFSSFYSRESPRCSSQLKWFD